MALDFVALIAQKDAVIHDYRENKYESLVGGHIRMERGHVAFVDQHMVAVDGKELVGETVLIATGSRPVIPEIDG
jgi:mercuric reductase